MDLAVAFGWGETEKILTVQLVGDLAKAAEVLAEANLCVAAARVLRDQCESGVRKIGRQCRLEPARTNPRLHRPRTPTPHADGVDHDVVPLRSVDDLALADEPLSKADWAAVFSITQ